MIIVVSDEIAKSMGYCILGCFQYSPVIEYRIWYTLGALERRGMRIEDVAFWGKIPWTRSSNCRSFEVIFLFSRNCGGYGVNFGVHNFSKPLTPPLLLPSCHNCKFIVPTLPALRILVQVIISRHLLLGSTCIHLMENK